MSERTCGSCRAFLAYDGYDVGSCQLHPPQLLLGVTVGVTDWVFPPVYPQAWCLDWTGKEKAQAVTQGTTSRKTVYPSDFVPNERAEAMAKAQGQNIHAMVAAWRDHHKAKGSLMADWQASLMTWLRNDVKFKEGRR